MTLTTFSTIRAGAAVMLAMFLASCTVVDEGPRPRPPISERPDSCTREYAPVCGERGRDRQTFGNACVARSEGFRIVGQGECRRDGRPGFGRDDDRRPDFGRGDDRRPGAGRGDDRRPGFGRDNDRRPGSGRDDDRRPGAGRDNGRGDDRGRRQVCTQEYDPVCARPRGERPRTYGNRCEAESANATIIGGGEC